MKSLCVLDDVIVFTPSVFVILFSMNLRLGPSFHFVNLIHVIYSSVQAFY